MQRDVTGQPAAAAGATTQEGVHPPGGPGPNTTDSALEYDAATGGEPAAVQVLFGRLVRISADEIPRDSVAH